MLPYHPPLKMAGSFWGPATHQPSLAHVRIQIAAQKGWESAIVKDVTQMASSVTPVS